MRITLLGTLALMTLFATPSVQAAESCKNLSARDTALCLDRSVTARKKFAGTTGDAAKDAQIARLCRARWADDYSMELSCRRTQTEGFLDLLSEAAHASLDTRKKPIAAKALVTCVQRWHEDGLTDFNMAHSCFLDQMTAAHALGYD